VIVHRDRKTRRVRRTQGEHMGEGRKKMSRATKHKKRKDGTEEKRGEKRTKKTDVLGTGGNHWA